MVIEQINKKDIDNPLFDDRLNDFVIIDVDNKNMREFRNKGLKQYSVNQRKVVIARYDVYDKNGKRIITLFSNNINASQLINNQIKPSLIYRLKRFYRVMKVVFRLLTN